METNATPKLLKHMKVIKLSGLLFHYVSLTIALFIFRTGFPVFKYIFFILYILFASYIIWKIRKNLFFNLPSFFKAYFLVALSVFLLITSTTISTNKIYNLVISDIINIFLIGSIFYCLIFIIDDKKVLYQFLNIFIKIIIVLTFLLSTIILLNDYTAPETRFSGLIKIISDLSKIDYNFSLVSVFISLIGTYNILLNSKNIFTKLLLNLLLIFFSGRILFSGSRRGFMLLLILIIAFIIINLCGVIKSKSWCRTSLLKSHLYFSILLFIFLLFKTVTSLNNRENNENPPSLGLKTNSFIKSKISKNLYREISVFNTESSFIKIHEKLWSLKLDPKDPDSGWGTLLHKSVYPLKGKNVEIVPKEAIGYLLDSTSGSCNESPGYCDTYTEIFNLKVQKSEKYRISVYCFVSEDFDGLSARIIGGWIAVKKGIIKQNSIKLYNLKSKGTWQKLSIEFDCVDEGNLPVYISFNRNNPIPFKQLNGSVIFAYPECKKITLQDSALRLNSIFQCYDSTNYSPKLAFYNYSNYSYVAISKAKESYYYICQINKSYKKRRNKSNVNIEYDTNDNIKNEKVNSGMSSIMFVSQALNLFSNKSVNNFLLKMVNNDTTYYGFKADLITDFGNIDLGEDRITRWKFAIEIFTKEYNWTEKLLGGGFDFLNWYGKVFKNDKTKTDYPHNPFLHILLYAGIVGVLLYILLLYKVINLYWRYRKEYPIMFFSFFITYFFTFFSGGNPFDPPIMGFFMMLPFFIHMIHKKDLSQTYTNK